MIGPIIIGDVEIGEDSSIWRHVSRRRPLHSIGGGEHSGRSVIHVMGQYPLILGDSDGRTQSPLTVDSCESLPDPWLHHSQWRDDREGSIVAGSLILGERKSTASLVVGHPAKIKRQLTGIDQASIDEGALCRYRILPRRSASATATKHRSNE